MSTCLNPKPLVSVCIAVYNAVEYIERALFSVKNQTYDNLEVIIINDASSDDTKTILTSFANTDTRFVVYDNATNLGYLATFNKALNLSNGELICFVDADDWISDDKIEKQVSCFIKNDSLGIVGTNIYRTDAKGNVVGVDTFPSSNAEITNYLKEHVDVCMCGSSVMISNEVKKNIGGYRDYFADCPAEDYDWIRRICEKYESFNLSEPLYYYRFTDNSLTRKVHYSTKARFAQEITKFLAEQRLSKSEDSLMNVNDNELQNFIDEIDKRELGSKYELYFSTAIQHSVNGDFLKSINDCFVSRKHGLNFLRFFYLAILVTLIFCVPNSVLLKLKNTFGIKSVAKSL